jgi:hypothetical protein
MARSSRLRDDKMHRGEVMPRMRARDVRAIAFWIGTSLVLLAGVFVLSRSVLAAVALTGAWNLWLLTRPRMRRVLRRLRGDPDYSGYFWD